MGTQFPRAPTRLGRITSAARSNSPRALQSKFHPDHFFDTPVLGPSVYLHK